MYHQFQAHPMAYKQMGGFLDDLWDDATSAAQTQVQQIINKAPAQIANAAAGAVIKNPSVQQAATQSATQAAIDKTAQELNALKTKLSAQLSAFTASPVGWVKANPGKALIVVGTVAGIGTGIYFLVKGMKG